MNMTTYSFTKETAEEFASVAMGQTVSRLVETGALTEQQAETFLNTHTAVILTKKSISQRLYALLFERLTDDTVVIKIVPVRKP